MSKTQQLTAHTRKRSGTGALNQLRREGLIPAVVYGKHQKSLNLRLNRKEVLSVLHHSVSEQILVSLVIEDTKETKLALLQDVQHNPLTGAILHMDFHAVREDEIIHAHVPIELVGEAAGVKAGGLLEFLTHSLNITCLPLDLPEKVTLDITTLGLNETMHVSDLVLPKGVKAEADGGIVVVLVAELRGGAAEPVTPAADAAKGPAKKAAAPSKTDAPAAAPAKKAAKK